HGATCCRSAALRSLILREKYRKRFIEYSPPRGRAFTQDVQFLKGDARLFFPERQVPTTPPGPGFACRLNTPTVFCTSGFHLRQNNGTPVARFRWLTCSRHHENSDQLLSAVQPGAWRMGHPDPANNRRIAKIGRGSRTR